MAKIASMTLTLAGLITGLGPPAPADEPPEANRLRERIEAILAPLDPGVTVAVAYRDLETGREILVRPDLPIHPASTMKVPVMMEVYRQSAAGQLTLDDRLPIKNSFVSIADGSLYTLDPKDDSELTLYERVGKEATVRELVRLMITESSNLATNLLIDRVSAASTTAFMETLGAGGVRVLRGVEDGKAYARGLNNVATARGLMTILVRLAERSVVSEGASNEMLGVLRGQKFNEGIPVGLPPGTPVAHKTGSFRGVYHDIAVVEPPGRKPFVLVVLTRGIENEAAAHKLVAEIARAAIESTSRDCRKR
jgi:beta-lactamase class A